ncbi:sugar nucleotide-binding protein [Candidatus Halobeggiatoa sp. HSG11]|nr:sugar nucleotide-binding protein [Candidatus Halobeggiatoa sp. HSG11]
MRILITGAAGVVGKALHRYLSYRGHYIIAVDLISSDKVVALDLRQKAVVRRFIKQQMPELIIHTAAIKDLVFCQQHEKKARQTNYSATENLVHACVGLDVFFIYFSSDYVFGKYDKLWAETDILCPSTQYGRDKAACERLIQEKLSHYAIIRTAQLYGFSGDFIHLLQHSLTLKRTFMAFANLINCPTWIEDVLMMVDNIIQYQHRGIFHCVGLEALSRYQYACEIAQILALEQAYIQAVDLDFSQDIRPPVVRLDGSATYAKLQCIPNTLQHNLHLIKNRK